MKIVYIVALLIHAYILVNSSNKNSVPDNDFFLERLRKGNRKVFAVLFDYYYSGLVVYAERFINDLNQAEDIVQSVFIKLWENRDSVKSIRSYLINSVKNRCIDYIRKDITHRKYIQHLSNNGSQVEYEFWAESELKEMIESAIKKLPDRCREVFLLSRKDGLKAKEIAHKLEISQRTVETHISKALKILRFELKDYFFLF